MENCQACHFASKLDTINEKLDTLTNTVASNHLTNQVDIAKLKVKSQVWGVIGGGIASIGLSVFALVIWFIKNPKGS